MEREEVVGNILDSYSKEVQFLQSFTLENNKGKADFIVSSSFYCPSDSLVEHFTAVELQICLNQLLYTYFTHLGLFDYVNDDDFENVVNAQTFITEQTTHFKKEFCKSNISGEIEIVGAKRIHDLALMECKYNFEKNCYGTIKVALKDKLIKGFEQVEGLL